MQSTFPQQAATGHGGATRFLGAMLVTGAIAAAILGVLLVARPVAPAATSGDGVNHPALVEHRAGERIGAALDAWQQAQLDRWTGYALSNPARNAAAKKSLSGPVDGEFRLGPGNATPPGLVRSGEGDPTGRSDQYPLRVGFGHR